MARFEMSDRKYPIDTCKDVKDAWDLRGSSTTHSKAAVAAHVRRAAKALHCEGPWNGTSAEDVAELTTTLTLEGKVAAKPLILEPAEGQTDWREGGSMRVKVPFYIGNSITRADSFDQKILFPDSILQETVAAAKDQIVADQQRITVYSRHATALSGSDMPVGAVVDVERQGSVGYATLEISPTREGKDIQALIQSGHLNAVSLRSAPGRFAMERGKVNGQEMLVLQSLRIDGIDFAPDNPAMKTYGMEVLAAEARIEIEQTSKEETVPDNLTLEDVKADRKIMASLVAEIEAPLRAEIVQKDEQVKGLTTERDVAVQERDALKAEKAKVAKDSYIEEIVAVVPDDKKEAARTLLQSYESVDQIAVAALPIVLKAKAVTEPPKTREQLFAEMFPGSGAGNTEVPPLTQEPSGAAIKVGGSVLEIPE